MTHCHISTCRYICVCIYIHTYSRRGRSSCRTRARLGQVNKPVTVDNDLDKFFDSAVGQVVSGLFGGRVPLETQPTTTGCPFVLSWPLGMVWRLADDFPFTSTTHWTICLPKSVAQCSPMEFEAAFAFQLNRKGPFFLPPLVQTSPSFLHTHLEPPNF